MPHQAISHPAAIRALLASIDLFEGLDEAALAELCAGASPRRLAPGTVLIEQGAEAVHLHIVAAGCLKISHLTPAGAQFTLDYRGAGERAVYAAILWLAPYPVSVRAVETSTVLSWTSAQLDAVAESQPALIRNALRIACADIDDLLHRVRELATEQVEQRIARALKRLLPAGARQADGLDRTPPLSRQDIAEMTGATHFTVSRILSAWEADGIIQTRRPHVVVRDAGRLARIAEGLAGRKPIAKPSAKPSAKPVAKQTRRDEPRSGGGRDRASGA